MKKNRSISLAFSVICSIALNMSVFAQNIAIEQKVDSVLKLMTLEEKRQRAALQRDVAVNDSDQTLAST